MDLLERRNMLMRGGDSTDWKALFMGMVDGSLSGDIVIPDTVTTIREGAFNGMTALTSVVATGVTSIGTNAFNWCLNIESVTFGTINAIGSNVFSNCRKLITPITLSDAVTSIGASAFTNCYKIPWIDIGGGVTSIGNQALRHLNSCQYIICRATTPPTMTYFADSNITPQYPIYVPDASVAAYKAESGWSNYGDRIKPLSDFNNT